VKGHCKHDGLFDLMVKVQELHQSRGLLHLVLQKMEEQGNLLPRVMVNNSKKKKNTMFRAGSTKLTLG